MIRPPSILYLVNALESDAPTRLTAATAFGLEKRGWQTKFIAWSRGGELQQDLEAGGVETAVLGKGMLLNAVKMAKIIREFQPDIVHTALARPALGMAVARMLCRRKDLKWIAADHGVHEWHERGAAVGWLMERIMPAVLNSADQVVTVSVNARRQLMQQGLNASHVQAIPNGVDVSRFYPRLPREKPQLIAKHFPSAATSESIFLIGAAGNLRRLKGFDVLIAAAAELIAKIPGARFIIWGSGPEREALISQVKSLSLESYVSFAGHEPDIENHLPLLDLYIQPSRIESFGLGAAEAMASGVPVIVSDVGGLSDLVEHGKSGLKVEPGHPTELAAEISELYGAPKQRAAMGEAARLRIVQHYSQQGMVSAMVRLYEQLLPGSQARHD